MSGPKGGQDRAPASQSVCRVCAGQLEEPVVASREMMYGTGETFTFATCHTCGALTLTDPPAELGKYYPPSYQRRLQPKDVSTQSRLLQLYLWRGRSNPARVLLDRVHPFRLPRILGELQSRRRGGFKRASVLDVGCGSGQLLLLLSRLGFARLDGVDPYAESRELLDGRVRISGGTVDQAKGRYDFVILNHSLEHISDQSETLSRVRALCGPDASVLVRTPLADSRAFEIYRGNWYQLDPPRHLLIHTARSLRRLASLAGFEVEVEIRDSNRDQFLRSELATRGIAQSAILDPAALAVSLGVSPEGLGSRALDRRTRSLNFQGLGDQGAFYLRPT